MANKIIQKKMKRVYFEIDKEAFKGPFTCCNKKTKIMNKKIICKGFEFNYDVWYCDKCKKEYLDSEQAKRLERFWMIERLLKNELISMERHMNYDGKTYFFRFPKELSKKFNKTTYVDIKLINPETFLIEVKS